MRVDPVLVVSAALLFGAFAATSPLPAVLAAGAVLLLLRGRISSVAWLIAALAFALSAWRARSALHAFETARLDVQERLHSPLRCAGRAEIVESPTVRSGTPSLVVSFGELDCEGQSLGAGRRARVYGGPADLRRGDVVDVVAQLAPVELFRNVDLPDPTPAAARRGATLSGMALSMNVVARGHGLSAFIDIARAHARRRIEATFSPAAVPMARALVLGENDLDPEDDQAFKRSGLSHLLAVSGTHLVFAVLGIVRALGFLFVRIERFAARGDVGRVSAGAGAVLSIAYADFAGGSGSAWRAAWMLSAGLTARAAGRHPTTSRSIAASLAVGALLDPLSAFDISFLLSLAATTGLVVVGQPMARAVQAIGNKPLRFVALSLTATTASMLLCAPLLAVLSPEITLAGMVANVLAAPVGEVVALPLCLAHSLLSALPMLERGVALVASGSLLVVKAVAHGSASVRCLAVPVPLPGAWHAAVAAVGGVGLALPAGSVARSAKNVVRLRSAIWALALAVSFVVVELAARRAGRPHGELRVTAVDVGQGDATLVDLPDGRVMLVDGGGIPGSPIDPGRAVLLPLLRARRRTRIDLAVLSHPHPDHFTGLSSTLESVEVGELWDSGQGEAEGAGPVYAKLISGLRARGVPIRRPHELCGKKQQFGAAELELLAPCPKFVPMRGANDNSLVVRIAFGKRAALLSGDAERQEEAEIVSAHGARLRADFLKAGHHGSRTSSNDGFLAAVRPSIATLSCGTRNRFGHPHAEALGRLVSHDILALRLDRTGSVIWRTDGQSVDVRAFRGLAAIASPLIEGAAGSRIRSSLVDGTAGERNGSPLVDGTGEGR